MSSKKTLSKQFTLTYFYDEDETKYYQIRKAWKDALDKGYKPSFVDHIVYLALLGKDWTKAYTPATNVNKLANGYINPKVVFGYYEGSYTKLFSDLITKDSFNKLLKVCDFMTFQLSLADRRSVKDFKGYEVQ